MKINKKVITLLEEGFSINTLRNMSDNSINYLYSKLLGEQEYTSNSGGSISTRDPKKALELSKMGAPNVRLEKKEMGEAKKKPQSKNPFAICTAQLKKEFGTSERSEWTKTQMKKYERCVMDIKGQPKKDMKEANMIDSFIENQMSKMVESHLNPQITKSALLRHLREQDAPTIKPVVKPAKPTTKPTRRDNPFINPNPKVNPDPKANTETKPIVKPAKPTTKPTRRDNPFINPNPKVNPDPKAISPEKAKNAIIDNIMQLLNFEN
jgi:hypothetical protein